MGEFHSVISDVSLPPNSLLYVIDNRRLLGMLTFMMMTAQD